MYWNRHILFICIGASAISAEAFLSVCCSKGHYIFGPSGWRHKNTWGKEQMSAKEGGLGIVPIVNDLLQLHGAVSENDVNRSLLRFSQAERQQITTDLNGKTVYFARNGILSDSDPFTVAVAFHCESKDLDAYVFVGGLAENLTIGEDDPRFAKVKDAVMLNSEFSIQVKGDENWIFKSLEGSRDR